MDHPLFMSADGNADPEKIEALQHLLYDDPPNEVADRFRHQGNEQLKLGRPFWNRAIGFYTQGIEVKCDDKELASNLYSNRAHVQLLKGNFRSARLDSEAAIALNPKNVKAFYRAAKACLSLSKWNEAKSFAEGGLSIEADNKELLSILQTSEEKLKIEAKRTSEVQEKQREEEQKRMKLREEIEGRGILFSDALVQNVEEMRHARIYVDGEGVLHLPLYILYPESHQSDFIRDTTENDFLYDHLAAVFEQPPPWDTEGKYKVDDLEIFVATFFGVPTIGRSKFESLGGKSRRPEWVAVDPTGTIGEMLQIPGHVVRHFPIIHILVKGSKACKTFMESEPRE